MCLSLRNTMGILAVLLLILGCAAARDCVRDDIQRGSAWELCDCTSVRIELHALGAEATQALATAMETSNQVRTLRLRHASIGDRGAEALAELVRKPASVLSVLEIWRSEVGPQGCTALAEALTGTHALHTLDLRSTRYVFPLEHQHHGSYRSGKHRSIFP